MKVLSRRVAITGLLPCAIYDREMLPLIRRKWFFPFHHLSVGALDLNASGVVRVKKHQRAHPMREAVQAWPIHAFGLERGGHYGIRCFEDFGLPPHFIRVISTCRQYPLYRLNSHQELLQLDCLGFGQWSRDIGGRRQLQIDGKRQMSDVFERMIKIRTRTESFCPFRWSIRLLPETTTKGGAFSMV
jgi:hypothetical protein